MISAYCAGNNATTRTDGMRTPARGEGRRLSGCRKKEQDWARGPPLVAPLAPAPAYLRVLPRGAGRAPLAVAVDPSPDVQPVQDAAAAPSSADSAPTSSRLSSVATRS
jgi:hypothetical protein